MRLGTGTRKRQAQSQGSGEAWVQVPARTPRGRVNLQASGSASLGLGFLVSTGREQRCPGRAAVRKRPGYHHCSRASPVAVAGSPGSAGTGRRSGSRQAVELKQRPPSLHWLQHEKPKPKQNAAPALTSALVPAEASTHWDICGCHALNRVPGVCLHSAGVPWARGGGEAGSFLWAPPPRTLCHLQHSLPGVVPSTTPPSSASAITPEGCPGACGYCPPATCPVPGGHRGHNCSGSFTRA